MKYILTFEDEIQKKVDSDRFVEIPSSTSTENDLISLYRKELSFPEYFGTSSNWDAFYDILSDLYWLDINKIVIYHESLPQLDEKDIRIYMGIINDLIKHSDEDGKTVEFIFNTRDKEKIQYLL
jgi:hypothetical protein